MLDKFLELNPWSSVIEADGLVVVQKPWGDGTLDLAFSLPDVPAIEGELNSVVLSPRFEGLFHSDSGTLELLFTQLAPDDPLFSKAFSLNWNSSTYTCKYAASSTRALTLAQYFRPVEKDPDQEYRGLVSFPVK